MKTDHFSLILAAVTAFLLITARLSSSKSDKLGPDATAQTPVLVKLNMRKHLLTLGTLVLAFAAALYAGFADRRSGFLATRHMYVGPVIIVVGFAQLRFATRYFNMSRTRKWLSYFYFTYLTTLAVASMRNTPDALGIRFVAVLCLFLFIPLCLNLQLRDTRRNGDFR
jgi:hypothetical protein